MSVNCVKKRRREGEGREKEKKLLKQFFHLFLPIKCFCSCTYVWRERHLSRRRNLLHVAHKRESLRISFLASWIIPIFISNTSHDFFLNRDEEFIELVACSIYHIYDINKAYISFWNCHRYKLYFTTITISLILPISIFIIYCATDIFLPVINKLGMIKNFIK